MPRTDRDGKAAQTSVSWLLCRPVADHEMAAALHHSPATYSRRKRKADFPTLMELRKLAQHFRLDETILQADFGYVDPAALNGDLQRRYATYRRAVDAIASMCRGKEPTCHKAALTYRATASGRVRNVTTESPSADR